MKTTLNLLRICIVILLVSCGPSKEELFMREKQSQEDDVEAMETDLLKQRAAMDSIAAVQEIEIAQQIVLKQQLMDLKSKMASEESRLKSSLDSK